MTDPCNCFWCPNGPHDATKEEFCRGCKIGAPEEEKKRRRNRIQSKAKRIRHEKEEER